MSSFDSFRSSLKGNVILSSDAEYSEAIKRWASNAQRPAKLIVFVKDANDVSLAIKYATEQKLPIAVCSSGKHGVSAASSVDGGLVIDLSKYLSGIRIDPEQQLAYVEGGAMCETIDKAAIEHGLATVVGSVNDTGIGGLITGGGYGWLSPLYGLALDNLVEATVVTASGAILTASPTSHPDLFWGIRGCGSNLGVCTELVLKLHPQRQTVFAGIVVFPAPLAEAIFEAQNSWWNKGPSGKEASYVIFDRIEGAPIVAVMMYYNGSEEEGRAAFKHLFDLGPIINTTAEVPFEKLNSLLNDRTPPGKNIHLRSAFLSTPSPSAPSISAALASTYESFIATTTPGAFPGVASFVIIHEFYPSGVISSVPSNATAYHNRDPKLTIFAFGYWRTETEGGEKEARQGVAKMLNTVIGLEGRIKPEHNLGYANFDGDASSGGFERAKIAFGGNYERLREVKKKYDPELVFNRWYAIEPAA